MEHMHRRRSGLRRADSTAVAAAGAMILVVGLSQLGTASPGTGTAQGTTAAAARPMENLGRGVVAVHSGGHDGAGTGGGRRHAGDRARPRHQRPADGPRTARPGPRAGALRRAGAASQPRPYLGMRPAGALRRPGARRRRGTARAHGRRPGHRPPPCAARADRHHRRTRRPGRRVHPLDPEPARVCAWCRSTRSSSPTFATATAPRCCGCSSWSSWWSRSSCCAPAGCGCITRSTVRLNDDADHRCHAARRQHTACYPAPAPTPAGATRRAPT
jgi:hypothetical protein